VSLRKSTFSGVRWTSVSSLSRVLLQLLQVAILARLLTPADFGLVAVVLAIIAVVQIFSDAGVSNAIIHYQDVTPRELDSLYWLNAGSAAILALVLIALSPWLARWYAQPQLRPMLAIAASTLFVGALSQQLRVVAQKKLRFMELAMVELGGALVGCGVAITLAVLGARAYSLLLGSFGTAAATTGLAWMFLSDGWRPRAHMAWDDIQRFVGFGVYIIGNNLANTFNTQVDVLLGAQLLGASSIGLYSVPKDVSLRLASVINPIVTEVSFPVMASAQADRGLVKRLYLQMMRMTASITFPAYVAMGVFAPEVVQVALGREWAKAAPLLRILAAWALFRSIGNPVGTMLMALGRPGRSFAWNVALLAVMPPAIWMGSRLGGLQGMALALTILAILIYLPNWYFLVRPLCGAQLGEYTYQLAVPLFISLLAGMGGYLAAAPFVHSVPRLIVGGSVGAAVYLGASLVLNRPWSLAMVELVGLRR
jgi:lipopolysaccharide exporter